MAAPTLATDLSKQTARPEEGRVAAADQPHAAGEGYLDECRALVIEEIRAIIRTSISGDEDTYGLMLDYPVRRAKGLRPALCIAVCRALGGELQEVVPSAAVLEIYHNAFLIHDDIEDGSLTRRGKPALHQVHGIPAAVNCGDGLLALTLRPLLKNTDRLGLGRALRVLEIYAAMVTEAFEGQTLELRWIQDGTWHLCDADYEAMVLKKTCGYSFVAPALVGAAVANSESTARDLFVLFLKSLGLAFQIQDDILNLEQDGGAYGKELAGDLWEGKRTLMLLHALRSATDDDRARAIRILAKPRPAAETHAGRLYRVLEEMFEAHVIDDAGHRAMKDFVERRHEFFVEKTEADIRFLRILIDTHGSIPHARSVAMMHAEAAEVNWRAIVDALPDSVHLRFLGWLKDYVLQRKW